NRFSPKLKAEGEILSESEGSYIRRRKLGTLQRCSLSSMPPRGHEAVPQRPQMFYRQVSCREAQLRARPARKRSQGESCWIRPAAARKAESQAHVLHAGRPVPQLL